MVEFLLSLSTKLEGCYPTRNRLTGAMLIHEEQAGANAKLDAGTELPLESIDRIERFLAAFNAIEQYFRTSLRENSELPFLTLLFDYSKQWPMTLDDLYLLRACADLRNAIVHHRTEPRRYISVPVPSVVWELEEIYKRLLNPKRVIPRFAKPVETLEPRDTLSVALRKIRDMDISQFPVYAGEVFTGLLTENGVTRWLAHHTATVLSLVDFEEVFVEQVVAEEEKRPNWKFISRDKAVDEVVAMFAANPSLEAALITQHGKHIEKPLGIITRSDILEVKRP